MICTAIIYNLFSFDMIIFTHIVTCFFLLVRTYERSYRRTNLWRVCYSNISKSHIRVYVCRQREKSTNSIQVHGLNHTMAMHCTISLPRILRRIWACMCAFRTFSPLAKRLVSILVQPNLVPVRGPQDVLRQQEPFLLDVDLDPWRHVAKWVAFLIVVMDSQHIDRHHPVRKNAGGVSEKIIVIVVGLNVPVQTVPTHPVNGRN